MSYLIDKPAFIAQMHESVLKHVVRSDERVDGMKLMQVLAGMLVETLLLFDEPDEGLDCSIVKLSAMLDTVPREGELGRNAMPPSYMIDYETEYGRGLARAFFEEWLNCAYEFHDLVLFVIQHSIMAMERDGQGRSEIFRIFIETAGRCLAYELAAQELCDLVIDQKIGRESWSVGESIVGLSAVAGRRIALLHQESPDFDALSLPVQLEKISYVMMQEAVRLGLPAGSDWRFGLAANDYHTSAPYELIVNLEPGLWGLFDALSMRYFGDQAVACAKAAGRMLAVAAGGKVPELEPVIAKPLAMAAMMETFKTVCQEEAIISC